MTESSQIRNSRLLLSQELALTLGGSLGIFGVLVFLSARFGFNFLGIGGGVLLIAGVTHSARLFWQIIHIGPHYD